MKIKFNRNLVGAVLFFLFSMTLLLLMPSQIKVVSQDAINSATFPRLIVFIMAGCSLYLIIIEIIKIIRKQGVEIYEIDLAVESRTLVVIGLLILFYILLSLVPFWAAALIFATGLMLFMGSKSLWKYATVFVIIISVTLLFTKVLNVTLP
ncbi:MAG: tripartite tricarboxylate transporter TctB family protein [Eubacteriales bacterium]|nr:tripartite tricarboxylate transporter TctB family protein [Eubacteriales bacterium]